jgi:hypothetical protein
METKYSNKQFLDWYFGGSDQEQQQTLISLGEWVKDMLYEYGRFVVDREALEDDSNMDIFFEDMEYIKNIIK